MTIPSWLKTRPALYVGIAVAVLVGFLIWLNLREARIRRDEAARVRVEQLEKQIAQKDTQIVALIDTVEVERMKTDTIVKTVTRTVVEYEVIRSTIDTAHSAQPPGTPEGMVLVPVSFVAKADSLADQVPRLTYQLNQEREATARLLAADSAKDRLYLSEIAQLKIIAGQKAPPSTAKKILYAVGGGLVALGAERIIVKH